MRLDATRAGGSGSTDERMAAYRQQLEAESKQEVQRQVRQWGTDGVVAHPVQSMQSMLSSLSPPQVDRIREVEVASMRLEEAVKFRKQVEGHSLEGLGAANG